MIVKPALCCNQKKCRGVLFFVRLHPFKEGWQVRQCELCAQRYAIDGRRLLSGKVKA